MAQASNNRKDKWWGVAKAVAYELRPFTLPTKGDLKNAAEATKTNANQLWVEAKRLAPEVVEIIKGLNPLRALEVFAWLGGWALFIWLEFGAVYFIVSAMVMIFVNLGEREDGEWSAYSVFNAGCRALLGTINAEQFEREIMRQNPAAPADDEDEQEDEYVWVDPPGRLRAQAIAAGADNNSDASGGEEEDDDEEEGDDDSGDEAGEGEREGDAGGGGAGGGGDAGAARGGGRKVSGKRARRGFEERRERREERRLALQALGQGDWD